MAFGAVVWCESVRVRLREGIQREGGGAVTPTVPTFALSSADSGVVASVAPPPAQHTQG
jgi:hypothetical protein